jgi:ABC-2 type transport system ATP-binding protein
VPAVVVEELVKAYGPVEVLRGISFEIADGEVFALLGPNGAGKTTTVEILEGFRTGWTGRVEVLGHHPATGGVRLRRRIGMVLQSAGVDGELRVGEAVRLFGSYYDAPRPAAEVLRAVGLEDRVRARVATLSGGQRRRLDLALALVGDPDLLFLDEPTTGFDPTARQAAWDLVRSLREAGKSVLLTTHYLEEAQALADRVGILVEGRMAAVGTADELLATRSSVVSVRLDPGAPAPPVGAPGRDRRWEVATGDAAQTVRVLLAWAATERVTLHDLGIERPSLEALYFDLTRGPVLR